MGRLGDDQTACLGEVARFVAEEHSRDRHKYRTLTKERKQTDKNQ